MRRGHKTVRRRSNSLVLTTRARGVSAVVFIALLVLAAALLAANVRRSHSGGVTRSGGNTTATVQPPSAGPNPVRLENARRGTKAWDVPLALAGHIEGYPSSRSVLPGSTLDLHVSTRPAVMYRVRVYRLGWYQGNGARLVDCIPSCTGAKQGVAQPPPVPDASGLVRAGWPVTDQVVIGQAWVSGYYVAKLELTAGDDRGKAATVPFIVRAPATERSTILVQAPVNTWQAYNNWGGKSLYDFNSAGGIPATRVSFDRPLVEERVLNYPFTWEYPLVRFLEREGYDLAYTTDVDTHADPNELKRHRLVIVAGHDEYWSKEIRDAFDTALSGTNLAFIGANIGVWQIRYEDAGRTIVGYKLSPDPIADAALKTTRFRELGAPKPECQLLGVQSHGGLAASGDPPRAYMPVATDDPWFDGTGLSSSTPLADLVGYEWDTVQPGCKVPPLTVLFHYEGAPANADAVRYVAPSGARVFSAGSLQFTWALDDWRGHAGSAVPGVQRFMRNALADLTRPVTP